MPEKLAINVSAAGAVSVFQAVRDVLRKLRHKPSITEANLLIEFVKRIDERRVFSAPYNVEVVECCLASLSTFKSITEEYLAKLAHPGAQAAMGAILSSIRRFLDKWYGTKDGDFGDAGDRFPSRHGHWDERSIREAEFFKDLGVLRAEIRILLELLKEIEPKAAAASILEPLL